jgi:hypothetical protein
MNDFVELDRDMTPFLIDADRESDLIGAIRHGLVVNPLIVCRNVRGMSNDRRLSAYEYVNVMRLIGRPWTTADELAAEIRYQVAGFPEIIEIAHDGLLGSKKLPMHSDGSHHPARPYPGRALLPVVLPEDGRTTTLFYDLRTMGGAAREIVHDEISDGIDPLSIRCWHQPAYGTGWAGRWQRLLDIDPRTGEEFLAFDEVFINRMRSGNGQFGSEEWGAKIVVHFRNLMATRIRQIAPYYEHHWEPNDLLIWVNRGLAHTRDSVTPGQERRMWRITFDLTW